MADRYHCVDGVWMLGEDDPKFRSSDVDLYGVKEDSADGLWHIELVLKDGTMIYPDLTGWGRRDDAYREMRHWVKMIGIKGIPKGLSKERQDD